jgi:hypothetical protein
MKLYKTKYVTLQHDRAIWRGDNDDLYLAVFGISEPNDEDHPNVSFVTGKVYEGVNQPDEIEIQWPVPQVTPAKTKSIVLVDLESGFEEVRDVFVFDKMFITPAANRETTHPYTDINEVKAKKPPSELSDWEEARTCYFAAGGVESMLEDDADPEWYWRRAAKLGQFNVAKAERELEELRYQFDQQARAYNRTKCCVAAHHGDIDEDGNVWWKLES